MDKKVLLVIVVGILILVVFVALYYALYLPDYQIASSNGVPQQAYERYFSSKLWSFTASDSCYALFVCELANGTRVFDASRGRIFSDVDEKYFDSSGNLLCENYYMADCRDHCPQCLPNVTGCTHILGNC